LERIIKQTRIRGKRMPVHSHARNQFNLAGVVLYTLMDRYSKITLGSRDAMQDLIDSFEMFALKFCRQLPLETLQHPPTHEIG